MPVSKTSAVLGATVAAFATMAPGLGRAGDLAPPPIALPPAPIVDAPCCGNEAGWYLRGDIGVSANTTDKHSISTSPVANTAGGVVGYNDDLGSSAFGGVGAGYALNSWLRFDGTIEYRGGAQLSSVDYYTSTLAGGVTNGKDFYKANVKSIVGLANVYVDLGTWYCLTPYIGGGVGFSNNRISGFTDQGFSYGAGGNPGVAGAYFKEGNTTNFAWALMAGVSYDVSSNLKLDLGYRYLNLGKATSGSSVEQAAFSTGTTYKYTQKDIESHDVRLGMRWVFAEKSPAPQPVYQQPIIRKY